MMTNKLRFLGLSLVGTLAVLATSCSSSLKEFNPNMGLLDELAEMEPANHSGASGPGFARAAAPSSVSVHDLKSHGPAGTEVSADHFKQVSLHWPLQDVSITSPYGQRGHEFHEGVDLRAKQGTPVYSAHAGQVLYAADRIHGYGRMVVLKHSSGLATIYAHNSKLVVHRGQWISQGTLIAYTGNTGHSTGPHLHFEVRSGVSTVNPLSLLPKPKVASREHSGEKERLVAKRE